MTGKHRDLGVQGKRPDQLGVVFLNLARPGWEKGGKTSKQREQPCKGSEERQPEGCGAFPGPEVDVGQVEGGEPSDLRAQRRKG